MANELTLYQVAYTVHRCRLDGKQRKRSSDTRRDVGATAEEAIRKTLAHVQRFDRPPEGWTTARVEATAVEQVGTLRRCAGCGEFRADDRGILCVCRGRRCKRCRKRKIHGQGSSYYDGRDGHVWHVPWFAAPTLCPDCDPVDRVKARAWAVALSVEPRAHPNGYWHVLDSLGWKASSRWTLVARGRETLSELLGKLTRFTRESASPIAKTFAVTFSDGGDRAAYVLFVVVSTRAILLCEVGWLDRLVPTPLTREQQEALLARGFALTPSRQAARREVVIEDAASADREACVVLEVLFDVFGYRGEQWLQTSLSM